MKEELISFKTAKLAKEKGFNNNFIIGNVYNTNPTQNLLQKWLREVHGTIVQVECNFWDKIEGWNTYSTTIFYKTHDIATKSFYKTYEEALELGLQEALKIIKIEE